MVGNKNAIIHMVDLSIEHEQDVFPSSTFIARKPSAYFLWFLGGYYKSMGTFDGIQCFIEGPSFTLSSEGDLQKRSIFTSGLDLLYSSPLVVH